MKLSTSGMGQQTHEGGEEVFEFELWHACAGPLVSLPTVGSRMVYFPQGHSEQVAATTNKEVDAHIPNYPALPPQLICQLHNVTMHADVETDEVYAQMTLQPLTPQEQKDTYLPVELGTPSRQPTNYFCKTLTASDTSTHGGFSVPRRAAEKVFPPLDFSQTPPAQELIARDLHDVEWKFRHIFRGQPKRHLLTTGWSVFVSAKRLVAGMKKISSFWEFGATRPQTVMPSSVLSSDSMHIGLLAAAAHAAATNSCFTIFYNPRYMGTITGIGDLDPVRWPNSHWRSVKVGWDESTAGERQPRVSLWEIEPLTTFPMYPSLFPLRLKRPWYPGASAFQDGSNEAVNGMAWLRGETGEQGLHSLNFPSVGMFPWMQQRMDPTILRNDLNQQYQAMLAAGLQNFGSGDLLKQQLLQLQPQMQYLQHSSSHNPLLQQQQVIQQSVSPHMIPAQTQMLSDNLNRPLQQQVNNPNEEQQQQQQQQQQHAFQEAYAIQHEQLQQRQPSSVPSPSFSKTDFTDSNAKFSASVAPSSMQNLLGSLCSEGSSNLLNFSRTTQPMLNEQSPQQSWGSKFSHAQVNNCSSSLSLPPYPGKDASSEQGACGLNAQNQALFDSSALLLPTTVSSIGTSSIDTGMPSIPLGDSGFQSSLYGYVQDSSELLHGAGQDSPTQARTFVKVYKSGCVGRSLDISRFNSYHELRQELGQMFGIEGLLEDPQRSGWQLVFVDRENDVLLLGDDPWEAFVNNVWYIKILSPEDVQKLGKQEAESLSRNAAERMNSGSGDGRDITSRFPSLGSLEF